MIAVEQPKARVRRFVAVGVEAEAVHESPAFHAHGRVDPVVRIVTQALGYGPRREPRRRVPLALPVDDGRALVVHLGGQFPQKRDLLGGQVQRIGVVEEPRLWLQQVLPAVSREIVAVWQRAHLLARPVQPSEGGGDEARVARAIDGGTILVPREQGEEDWVARPVQPARGARARRAEPAVGLRAVEDGPDPRVRARELRGVAELDSLRAGAGERMTSCSGCADDGSTATARVANATRQSLARGATV